MKYSYIDFNENKFEDEIVHWDIDDQITHWNVRCWIAGNECYVDGRIEIHEVNECCVEIWCEMRLEELFNSSFYEVVKHTFKTKYHDKIINKINQAINEDRESEA